MATTEVPEIVLELGRQLKETREDRELSLGEAARQAGLSPEHLREVEEGFPKPEGGRSRGPTLAKLERIAEVYGLTVRLVPK